MDIDKLFKMPKIPAGGTKRKLPDNPTPELLKKLKMGNASSMDENPVPATKAASRVTIEDIEEEEEDRSFAPSGDADYFMEEDEEGRFYGGGLTSEQKEILNIFDNSTSSTMDDTHEMNITHIRRLLLNFERAVNKNQDQRSKYPNDPSKFIDSEADLDVAIKNLLPLSQAPILAYPELARSNALSLLVGLLTHENVDIVIDVVELIHELTDDDADAEHEEDEYQDAEDALKTLCEGLIEQSALELLVDNLSRLKEEEEADRQGVFHVMGIFENVIGIQPQILAHIGSKTNLLRWLLDRVQQKAFAENRQYAAELMSILLQNNQETRLCLCKNDGIEVLLKVLSQYRRKDPADPEDTEFMDNLFDSLCSTLGEAEAKILFLDAEGVDLMVLMMKEKKESSSRSIKVLDFALSGPNGGPLCEGFIEALGLKTLFSTFMGKSNKAHKTNVASSLSEDVAHILGVVSSLFSNLPSESTGRIRLLAKFVESEYAKVDKLLEIRDNARKRLKVTESQIEQRKEVTSTELQDDTLRDEEYIRRLDGGLFTLQTVDYILGWLFLEDDGVRSHALRKLARENQSINDVIKTLHSFHEHIDEESEASVSQKDILESLLDALQQIPKESN